MRKDPGYPYLAVAFQALGIIRLAPLFYGALACLGLYAGGRRWLGRFGGAAAVGLYCSSPARRSCSPGVIDMPTFTDASLIAAGTGALLWAVLAAEARTRRRTWAGLAGFVALEAASVHPLHRHRGAGLRGHRGAGGVAAAGRAAAGQRGRLVARVGVRVRRRGRDLGTLVYGGPLRSGYRPGEVAPSGGSRSTTENRCDLPFCRQPVLG